MNGVVELMEYWNIESEPITPSLQYSITPVLTHSAFGRCFFV